jgi:copper transport protein
MYMCRRQRAYRQALQRKRHLAQGIHGSIGERLWRSVWWCIALALCLGILSGCGGTLAPKQTAQGSPGTSPTPVKIQPFHANIQTFDRALAVALTITPNLAGRNVFTVRVRTNHASSLTTAVNVTLYTTMQDMPMGTDSIHLLANSDGSFSATGVLGMQGNWAIGIVIQTPDHRLHKGGVMLVTPA